MSNKIPKEQLFQLLMEIQSELIQMGGWKKLPPKILSEGGPTKAFGIGEMSFNEWLQWVFVPNAMDAVTNADLPPSSSVSTMAIREYDGNEKAQKLIDKLVKFDEIVIHLGKKKKG